ncbi:hypothetical protein DAERI_140121 [Deinococcus aerius]|uniref:Outer membrane protein beta-barrel domain-containing protein n=1 Tax=Deinococcus aerius TaxID=200253 RepID=A0A2I9DA21_9DEIO|nr:hypothetical protein [Deinococcus aerius]GBF07460.1 hypothetical protein DAERI_140121 [Deinococcus aerius]
MKKALLGILALTAVSSAAADSFGGFAGFGAGGAGLYYQTGSTTGSNLRFSLTGLNLFRGGSIGVGGEVAYLNNFSGLSLGGLDTYYGAGLGASVSVGANLGLTAYPHGLLGVRYNVTGPFNVFGEVNAGPTIGLSTGSSGLGFGFGARIGVDYQFR